VARLYRFMPGMGGIAVGIVLGYVLPAAVYRPGDLASAILATISVICAAVVVTMGLILSFALSEEEGEEAPTPDLLRVYAARQRALLEQLDETVELLREIRDALRAGVREDERGA